MHERASLSTEEDKREAKGERVHVKTGARNGRYSLKKESRSVCKRRTGRDGSLGGKTQRSSDSQKKSFGRLLEAHLERLNNRIRKPQLTEPCKEGAGNHEGSNRFLRLS